MGTDGKLGWGQMQGRGASGQTMGNWALETGTASSSCVMRRLLWLHCKGWVGGRRGAEKLEHSARGCGLVDGG